jgi:hypothetical protein
MRELSCVTMINGFTDLVGSLVTVIAYSDQFPKQFVLPVIVGQVVNLGCWRLSAALTEAVRASENQPAALLPLGSFQIRIVLLEEL